MKWMNSKLTILLTILFLALAASGQKSGRLGEDMDLTGTACGDARFAKKVIFTGTVMRREFAEDEITPLGIVIRDRKDDRTYINVDFEYLNEHFSGGTIASLTDILSKGRYLLVVAYQC
jgi:hypothetical protein